VSPPPNPLLVSCYPHLLKISLFQVWFYRSSAETEFRWSIGHAPHSPPSSSVLPPPSSSSCTCILLSTSHSPDLSSRCSSLVGLFLCGHMTATGVLAWQCCHRTFIECAQSKSAFRRIQFSTGSCSLVAEQLWCFK